MNRSVTQRLGDKTAEKQFLTALRVGLRVSRISGPTTSRAVLVEDGGSLAALQQILGHASIVTTQRYARLSDDAVRAEAERLAGRVGKETGEAEVYSLPCKAQK